MKNILLLDITIENSEFYISYNTSILNFSLSLDLKIGDFNSNYNTPNLFGNISSNYEPKTNDKLYFGKYTTIPRVKLKNLTKDYKIKSTTDVNTANAIFVTTENIHKYTDTHWYYAVPTESIKQFFADAKENGHIDDYYLDKINSAFEFYTNENVAVNYHTRSILQQNGIPYKLTDVGMNSERLVTINDSDVENYKSIINATCPIYSESDLLKHLNGSEALAIEEDMYNSLCEMFDSSDNDNWTIAMEIMANSDFEDSVLYLGLLFNKYHNKMQSNKTRNHVNFKSLLALMGLRNGYFALHIDDIASKLKKHGKLTKENLDILLKHLGDNIIDGGNSAIFKIKTITVSDEYLEALNQNYTLTIVDDYVVSPEVEEVNNTEDLETEAVEPSMDAVEEVLEEETITEEVIVNKVVIDFDNVVVESKTNNDGYFL
jgi:hypothetical protein